MARVSGVRRFLAACLAAGGALIFAASRGSEPSAFVGVPPSAPISAGADGASREASPVVMRSQGQQGRNVFGDRVLHGKPQVKAAKRAARWRSRKKYGSYTARQVPRRYPLYDILEELYDKVPTYSIVSEPEEPMKPVFKVPLTERYPWAGDLSKVNKKKQRKEHGMNEDRMEPLFGAFNGVNRPPMGRWEKYEKRMGHPTYNYPPWLNKPLIGHDIKVPGDMKWSKHRHPEKWQKNTEQRKWVQWVKKMKNMEKAIYRDVGYEHEEDGKPLPFPFSETLD